MWNSLETNRSVNQWKRKPKGHRFEPILSHREFKTWSQLLVRPFSSLKPPKLQTYFTLQPNSALFLKWLCCSHCLRTRLFCLTFFFSPPHFICCEHRCNRFSRRARWRSLLPFWWSRYQWESVGSLMSRWICTALRVWTKRLTRYSMIW